MDFENDVKIDESGLDVEWLRQADLMGKYCRHAAHAKAVMDRAKEALEVKEAEMDRVVREFPENYGISKITETVVKNAVLTTPQRTKASKNYIDAKYEYDMAVAAVRAIDQKKTALENLVKLHGMSYFAGPSVPRDLNKEWEQAQNQSNANKTVKVQRRRK